MKKTLLVLLGTLGFSLHADILDPFYLPVSDSVSRKANIILDVDNSRANWRVADCSDCATATSSEVIGSGLKSYIQTQQQANIALMGHLVFNSSVLAPFLDLEQKYCSQHECQSIIVRREISAQAHDISQDPLSAIVSNQEEFTGSDTSYVALHYPTLNIPQGATINSARLNLTATGVGNYSYQVKLDSAGSATFPLSSLSSTWNLQLQQADVSGATTAVGQQISIDLNQLLQNKLNQANWCDGNHITVLLKTNNSIPFSAFEHSSQPPPQLEITYSTDGTTTCGQYSFNYQHPISSQEFLTNELDNYLTARTAGATSFTSSMINAYLLLTGGKLDEALLDYADRSRHTLSAAYTYSDTPERLRNMHTGSYTGGNLQRETACTDFDLNSFECIDELITGDARFIAPEIGQCESNHYIMISPGRPLQPPMTFDTEKISSITGESCTTSAQCISDMLSHFNSYDFNPAVTGTQSFQTDIIHIAGQGHPDQGAFTNSIPSGGAGQLHVADTSESLFSALKQITNPQHLLDATFSNLLFNQPLNQNIADNYVYVSTYTPDIRNNRWQGNIKKFRFSNTDREIQDKLGNAVFSNGQYVASSVGYWSEEEQNTPLVGGVNSNFPETRKIYTFLDSQFNLYLTQTDNLVTLDNDLFTNAVFGVESDQQRQSAVRWLAGIDLNSPALAGDTVRNTGAVIDTNLVMANYPGAKPVLFSATHDGYLHAFDEDSGSELFSFFPPELLPSIYPKVLASQPDDFFWGIDGQLSTWLDDKNNNGQLNSDAENLERLFLYMGLGRSAASYYALNITFRNAPAVAWKFSSATTGASELGQAWSAAVPLKVRMQNQQEQKLVLITGGYDPLNSDSSHNTDDQSGRALYLVDAISGNLIWRAGPTTDSGADLRLSDMRYSIPATPNVIDLNGDGLHDRIYVADMGGQLWRFDIHNGQSNFITGGVIANLSSDGVRRRFFATPDVAKSSTGDLSISLGSGWKTQPLDTATNEAFFVLRDSLNPTTSYSKTNINQLYNASTSVVPSTDGVERQKAINSGFYINFAGNGEKLLTSSITVDDTIVFSSYLPPALAAEQPEDICDLRTATSAQIRTWAFSQESASATTALNNEVTLDPLLSRSDLENSYIQLPNQTNVLVWRDDGNFDLHTPSSRLLKLKAGSELENLFYIFRHSNSQ